MTKRCGSFSKTAILIKFDWVINWFTGKNTLDAKTISIAAWCANVFLPMAFEQPYTLLNFWNLVITLGDRICFRAFILFLSMQTVWHINLRFWVLKKGAQASIHFITWFWIEIEIKIWLGSPEKRRFFITSPRDVRWRVGLQPSTA